MKGLALLFVVAMMLTVSLSTKVQEERVDYPLVEAGTYVGDIGNIVCIVFTLPIGAIAYLTGASWWNCYYFPPWGN